MMNQRFARAVTGALLATTLGAALAAAARAPATTASRNLLKNPGFEQPLGDHPWMPAGWDTSQAGLSSVFFGRDTFLTHGGRYAVSVANLSVIYAMGHNWNQTLLVGREAWGKDLVFSVWTRSNGVQGRAYLLLQAYRDTISKMATIWGVDREEAAGRMNINKVDDPLLDLGWKRQYFSDPQTDWVRREVRVFVPPTTNVVFVRCGLFGTGQVIYDDASLTLEPAQPASVPRHTNLLADPGFEGDGNDWEYMVPPWEGAHVERDTTVAHGGRASIVAWGGLGAMVQTRAGVCQSFPNRALAGQHIRLSGWVHTDSLIGLAYLKLYAHTLHGADFGPTPIQYSMNTGWTQASIEMDVPRDAYQIWAWFAYNAPASGRVYYDDCVLEVLGPAAADSSKTTPPRHRAPARR